MFGTGLLILTTPVSRICQSLPRLLTAASQKVADTLYVHVAPDLSNHQTPIQCTSDVVNTVNSVFIKSAELCSNLDIRVLLHNFVCSEHASTRIVFPTLHKPCEIVLTDFCNTAEEQAFANFVRTILPSTELPLEFISNGASVEPTSNQPESLIQSYDYIVIGGTFDRLHNGHKILLAESLLRCNKFLAIGVTEGAMNSKKTLSELILPCDQRISELKEYLMDVKPSVKYHIEPITDPYGPSIVIPELECIVVSEETLKGGQMVNDRRKERGLSTLDIHVIKLVEDTHHSLEEEDKISSSSYRKRLLGTLLREPKSSPVLPGLEGVRLPYIIGLTGGIASGKSSVCARMKGLGANIVDCDKLGHQAYLKGTTAFQKIVDTFGEGVIDNTTGEINRRLLGAQVFADKEKLNVLNKIVWPAIADLAVAKVRKLSQEGASVVVLDAAVLLEAGWESMVHEIWCTVIPKQEAVARMKRRNNLSEEEALKRINSQISNESRVEKSNVVLCTLWEKSVTQLQVEKAWSLLSQRIPAQPEKSSKM